MSFLNFFISPLKSRCHIICDRTYHKYKEQCLGIKVHLEEFTPFKEIITFHIITHVKKECVVVGPEL